MNFPETIVTPGLVDVHSHFREPGTNTSETIASGTRAALLGGFVLVADMPNNPGRPTWCVNRMTEKHEIIRETAYIPVTANAGSQPEEDNIGELEAMSSLSLLLKLYAGPTTNNPFDYEASVFEPRIAEWHRTAPDKPIALHAGSDNLEDFIALIAGKYEHALHVCHVNSSRDVELVKKAKREDLSVTCGVCPHHLLKTSHDTRTEGWFARMKPPLAHQDEAEKLLGYLASGDIDIVETDHAPHAEAAKWQAEQDNPNGLEDAGHTTCFGVPGIEFAAPLLFYQAKRGNISMERLLDAMSTKPAEILGVTLDGQTRVEWDMLEYRIEEEKYTVESAAGWTPFLGKLAVGIPMHVQIGDKVLVDGYEIVGQDPRVISHRGAII